MRKVLIGIPTAGLVGIAFTMSYGNLIAHCATRAWDPPTTFLPQVVEGTNWIANRYELVEIARASGCTHVLFLDDDMSFRPQAAVSLLERGLPVVVTNYTTKAAPVRFIARDLAGAEVKTTERSSGMQEVAHSGLGFALIQTCVFDVVPKPWFMPEMLHGKCTSEDVPFLRRVREAGIRVWLDHDASKLVAHNGRKTWTWQEAA